MTHDLYCLVSSITYGSEIWGSWESTGGFTLSNQCDKLYLGFLKRVTHVPSGTDSWVVGTEIGVSPINYKIWEYQYKYWNRLAELKDKGRVLALAFSENAVCMDKDPNWCSRATKGLRNLGIATAGCREQKALLPLSYFRYILSDKKFVAMNASIELAKFDNRDLYRHETWSQAEKERRRTYARWFWTRGVRDPVRTYVDDDYLRGQLTRFRMGAHRLAVVTGAWNKMDRRDRICKCCCMEIVEDKVHFTFECMLYADIRSYWFTELFQDYIVSHEDSKGLGISDTDYMMRMFYAQPNQTGVALFIVACMNKREQFLS